MATLHAKLLGLHSARGERFAYGMQKEKGGYREVSSAQYVDRTLRFSAFLRSEGVKRGDKVFLLSENGPEWTIATLAALNLGAVVVPVAAISSLLEVQNSFRGSSPVFTILSPKAAAGKVFEEILRAESRAYIVWDLQAEEPLAQWLKFPAAEIDQKVSADDPAVLIFTSGTTGNPKCVPITHGNILFDAEAALAELDAREYDRLVSVLPLSHLFEFTGGFVTPTLVGATVTYAKSLKAEDFLAALKDTRATILVAVPLLFEVLARNLQGKLDALPGPLPMLFKSAMGLAKRRPLLAPVFFFPLHRALGGHLRYLMAGGSRLQPATFDFFRGVGFTLLQGYGLTETSPVLTVTNLRNAGPDHVGRPLPGIEVGIFDDAGIRQAVDVEGEIWAKGPNVFGGYLDPAHNEGVFFGEWFRTGDLGRFGNDGLLRITGRKKDIIVTAGGKNVYPEEIEGTLLASGKFTEASALSTIDSSGHERVTLVLVPDRTKFPGLAGNELKTAAADQASRLCRILADYKWPQRIEVWSEELPKTSTRKVKKHELRKLLQERDRASVQSPVEGRAPSGGLNLENELEAVIGRGIQSITRLDPATVRLTDSLTKDLGLDSLTLVELVSHVETRFQTRVEGLDFAAISSVQDLVTALGFAAASKPKKSWLPAALFTDFDPRANGRPHWLIPRAIFNLLLRIYLRARHGLVVDGLENLDGGGPFLFTPNHSSHFDLLSIAGSLPASMVHKTYAVAAKDYFFGRTATTILSRALVNAIPFDRKGRVNESMDRCREALTAGGSLVIFPEGTRSPSGRLGDFKPGVGQLLAAHPTARAVPVFIDGAYNIMPKGSRAPGPGLLRIRYGRPISFRESGQDAAAFRAIADRLRAEVSALASRRGT